MESTKPSSMEPAEDAAAEAATERRRAVGSNGDAGDNRRAGQQHASQFLSVRISVGHRHSPDGYLVLVAATAGRNGIFSVPGGSSGVKIGSAILGAKFQSVKIAANCGWPGCVL